MRCGYSRAFPVLPHWAFFKRPIAWLCSLPYRQGCSLALQCNRNRPQNGGVFRRFRNYVQEAFRGNRPVLSRFQRRILNQRDVRVRRSFFNSQSRSAHNRQVRRILDLENVVLEIFQCKAFRSCVGVQLLQTYNPLSENEPESRVFLKRQCA